LERLTFDMSFEKKIKAMVRNLGDRKSGGQPKICKTMRTRKKTRTQSGSDEEFHRPGTQGIWKGNTGTGASS
jgi:hypothetical protein